MKTIFVSAWLLISNFVSAYSVNSQVLKPGQVNLVRLQRAQTLEPVVTSVTLDVKTQSASLPKVQSLKPSLGCQFKKTLISYSGFNSSEQRYIRSYEIQFLVALKSTREGCVFEITTDEGFATQSKTKVLMQVFNY